MKDLKTSFASRVRLYSGALIAMLLAGSVVQSEATIYTVTAGNYSASYDTSQNGFTSWAAGGVNQLSLQSLYYYDGSAVTPLTGASVTTSGFGSRQSLIATYTVSSGTIVDTFTLNGNTLGESIVFTNATSSTLDMKIFQYSNFVLGGPSYAGSQSVTMTPASVSGGYAVTTQTGGGLTFGWSADATAGQVSGTTLVQASSGGVPFGAFIGSGTDLDNTTTTASGYAVFGYEFSGSVAQGGNLSVSETSAFPVPVPEPASIGLISAGMLAMVLISRRRRDQAEKA